VNDYTTGIARLVRVIEVVQDGATRKDIEILAEKPLEPNNHLVSSVAFDVQLPPGTHTLIGGYRGDDKHAPSETSPIAVKVAAALRISPAEAVTMNYVIGEPAPPSVRFEALDQTTNRPVASNTMTVAAPVRFTDNGNFNHAGVLILVNGQRKALPFFVDSYAGATFEIQPLYESNTFIRFGFSSWSDGGASKHTVTVGTAPIALTLNSYRDYLVRTVIVGSGTIKRTPASPDSMYRENTVVTFEAVPAPGYKFVGWSNGLSGTNRVQTLKVTLNHTVQANFARL
jgi:hypothetical protein